MGNISSSERRRAMNRVDINNDVRTPPHSKDASRQEYLDESMRCIWDGNKRNLNDDGPGAFSAYTKAAIYYKKANDKKN
ncbi:MAG: hypothetical protein ACRCU0_05310 [Candidatus Rhabdochlamydia sp.]